MRQAYLLLFYFLIPFLVLGQEDNSAYNAAQKDVFLKIHQIESENRVIENMDVSALHSLPIGVSKNIGVTRYIIAIDSAVFKPNGAYFNAYMAVVFPGSNKRIAFAAKNIKFNPSGVVGGEQSRLALVSDHSLQISEHVTLNLRGDGSNYVEWNCNGFQAIHLKGEFEFSGDRMIPVVNGVSDPTQKVKAAFEIHTNDIHQFITSVSITPFTLKGLDDWSFKVTQAVVDMSEIGNHPSQQFPQGYSLELPAYPQLWTGFYLKELAIKLPPELSKHNQPTEVVAQHLLIDKSGFTGTFKVNNVFALTEGDMNGWGFSLDTIGVSFLNNKLSSGRMSGKVKIPAMENNGIQYSALISYHPVTRQTNYSFSISPQNAVSFNAFSARADIFPTSTITVQKINGKLKPKAVLNGKITFAHQNAETPALNFQYLTFVTDAPYLTNGVFAYSGDAEDSSSKVARFKVSISNFRLLVSSSQPKIGFDAMIGFMNQEDHSFSAMTTVLFGANVGMENGLQSWDFDKVSIGEINLQVATCSFYLNGKINFRDDDPIFGDGFEGKIVFRMEYLMDDFFEVNAQFGHTSYRYFYVDAFIPVTLPLGAVSITRLNGGLYYHMRPVNTMPSQFYSGITQTPSSTDHRTKYIPDQSISVGFKAGVSYQSNKSEKALNGDAMLEIAFASSGGLDFIRFNGTAFMMATVQERRTRPAPASGGVLIQYDNVQKIFDATLTFNVNAYGVSGSAYSKIHIEPQIWFVCVGKPTTPATISMPIIGNATAYIMVGNQLEPMASPPYQVASLVSSSGLNNQRNNEALSNASGFVAGARMGNSFVKSTQWDNFNFTAQFAYGAGFDMMLANFGPQAHCNGSTQTVGWNGWIAQGQIFAYLQGGIGVSGHIGSQDFEVSILSGTVAAIVQGKVPNPSYLYGALAVQYSILGVINGTYNFDFQIGNDCAIVN